MGVQTMKRWIPVLGVACVLGLQATALGQGQPDFSGAWTFSQEKSRDGLSGNSPDLQFPTQIVVKQSADELYVETSSVRQGTLTATFTLDGSTVTVEAPPGMTAAGTAMLEGTTVVVSTRRSYPSPAGDISVEFKETWSFAGNDLTVEKTRTQAGDSVTAMAVYDKR
jgi:hypothetical protein